MGKRVVYLIVNLLFLNLILVNLTYPYGYTLIVRLSIEDYFVWNGLDSPMVGTVKL